MCLKENFKKKEKEREERNVSWSGIQVGFSGYQGHRGIPYENKKIRQGSNGCQIYQPTTLQWVHRKERDNRHAERVPYPRQSCTRKRTENIVEKEECIKQTNLIVKNTEEYRTE